MRAWRRRATRKLRGLLGFGTMERAPLEPKITEELEFEDYTRQRVEIQTEPGVVMPMYVLIPKEYTPPYSAVIAAHGHGSAGKLGVAGVRATPELAESIDAYNWAYGLELVRAGFLTFCPDARGHGERREPDAGADIMSSSCEVINHAAHPLGQTVTGMWTWDIHRLIDYVELRPDSRANCIGCVGLSGGGLQTLWAAALDARIRCAVVSGYMYGYQESLLDMPGNCSCNYVPHLFEHVDMGDVGALIAPRPLLVETGTHDDLNGASGLENVRPQMKTIRTAYRLLGAEGLLRHHVFDGGHRWSGVEAIPWMVRHLAPGPTEARAGRRRWP